MCGELYEGRSIFVFAGLPPSRADFAPSIAWRKLSR